MDLMEANNSILLVLAKQHKNIYIFFTILTVETTPNNKTVGSVVEWLKRRPYDQHGLGSLAPFRCVLGKDTLRYFSLVWWSWQAVLN